MRILLCHKESYQIVLQAWADFVITRSYNFRIKNATARPFAKHEKHKNLCRATVGLPITAGHSDEDLEMATKLPLIRATDEMDCGWTYEDEENDDKFGVWVGAKLLGLLRAFDTSCLAFWTHFTGPLG